MTCVCYGNRMRPFYTDWDWYTFTSQPIAGKILLKVLHASGGAAAVGLRGGRVQLPVGSEALGREVGTASVRGKKRNRPTFLLMLSNLSRFPLSSTAVLTQDSV